MLWPAISLSAPRLRNWVIGIAGLSAAAVLVGVMIVQPCQIAPEPVAAPDHYTQVVPTIEWVALLAADLQFSGTAMSAIAKQRHPEVESGRPRPAGSAARGVYPGRGQRGDSWISSYEFEDTGAGPS